MTSTVHELCRQGTNLNSTNPRNGFVPLWIALLNEDYGTAQVSLLVCLPGYLLVCLNPFYSV